MEIVTPKCVVMIFLLIFLLGNINLKAENVNLLSNQENDSRRAPIPKTDIMLTFDTSESDVNNPTFAENSKTDQNSTATEYFNDSKNLTNLNAQMPDPDFQLKNVVETMISGSNPTSRLRNDGKSKWFEEYVAGVQKRLDEHRKRVEYQWKTTSPPMNYDEETTTWGDHDYPYDDHEFSPFMWAPILVVCILLMLCFFLRVAVSGNEPKNKKNGCRARNPCVVQMSEVVSTDNAFARRSETILRVGKGGKIVKGKRSKMNVYDKYDIITTVERHADRQTIVDQTQPGSTSQGASTSYRPIPSDFSPLHSARNSDCCANIGTLEIHTAGKGTQQAAIAVNRLHPEEPPSNFYPIEPPSGFQLVEPPSLPAPVEWTIDNAAASNDLGSPGLEFPPSAPFLDHESFLDYPD